VNWPPAMLALLMCWRAFESTQLPPLHLRQFRRNNRVPLASSSLFSLHFENISLDHHRLFELLNPVVLIHPQPWRLLALHHCEQCSAVRATVGSCILLGQLVNFQSVFVYAHVSLHLNLCGQIAVFTLNVLKVPRGAACVETGVG